jgi:midasin
MDLVGGFEQVDPQRAAGAFIESLKDFISSPLLRSLPSEVPEDAIALLEQLENVNQSPDFFASLALKLEALASKTSLPDFESLARDCKTLAETPMTLENARFEWVDGVLVKALERGDWLVLDNANLCSASVLDRLNSLLEPNGFLSINEHCGPDGEPKIVKPHADSRIFLTMDARFGEVSRAMRNRATEIFLEPFQLSNSIDSTISLRSEPAMERYDRALKALELKALGPYDGQLVFQVALDNLAWSDMPLLPRFTEAFHLQPQILSIVGRYLQIYRSSDYLKYRAALEDMWDKYAAKTGLSKSFRDAQVSDCALSIVSMYNTDRIKLNCRSSIRFRIRHWYRYYSSHPLSHIGSQPYLNFNSLQLLRSSSLLNKAAS